MPEDREADVMYLPLLVHPLRPVPVTVLDDGAWHPGLVRA
jgi:hypothetical protein